MPRVQIHSEEKLKLTSMTANLQQTISPVDGSIYAERQLATSREIENALAKAVTSQAQWKRVPVAERAAACKRMLDWLVERADEIGEELTWQIGRPIAYSPNEIRRGFQERVNYMAEIAGRELADIELEPKDNFRRFIRREPVGVVLVLGAVELSLARFGQCAGSRHPGREQRDPEDRAADAARRRTLRRSVQGRRFARRRLSIPAHRS